MREDWVEVKLGDVCNINMGQSPASSTYNMDKNGLPFYQGKAEFGDLHPSPKKWCNKPKKTAKPNDILISVRAPVGDTNISTENCAIGRGLAAISYDKCLRYIFYNLRFSKAKLDKLGTGTTFKAISGKILKEYSIPLPPLPEQRAIAAKIEQLFSDLDDGIANLKEAKEKLSIYRQSVLKKAFEGELTREWRSKQTDLPTADELLQQIKEERQRHYDQQLEEWKQAVKEWEANGKEGKKPGKPRQLKLKSDIDTQPQNNAILLPKSWRFTTLEALCRSITDGPFGSNLKSSDYIESGIRVIRLENIGNLIFKNDKKSYISFEKYRSIKRHTVYTGDIIFSSFISGQTNVAMVPPEIEFAINKADCFCVRSLQHISAEYLKYYLSTRRTYKALVNQVHGATRPRINTTQLKCLFVPICSLQEQNQIVQEIESRLTVCDKLEETINNSLRQAEALRQSILKRAFEGNLLTEVELAACRKEPDWEPVEKLLENVKHDKTIKKTTVITDNIIQENING